MREKLYHILSKAYKLLMTASFFAGLLPVLPFIVAVILGGEIGEAIALFLYQQYYVWVIAGASAAVLVGLVAMYVGKKQGMSVKTVGGGK